MRRDGYMYYSRELEEKIETTKHYYADQFPSGKWTPGHPRQTCITPRSVTDYSPVMGEEERVVVDVEERIRYRFVLVERSVVEEEEEEEQEEERRRKEDEDEEASKDEEKAARIEKKKKKMKRFSALSAVSTDTAVLASTCRLPSSPSSAAGCASGESSPMAASSTTSEKGPGLGERWKNLKLWKRG